MFSYYWTLQTKQWKIKTSLKPSAESPAECTAAGCVASWSEHPGCKWAGSCLRSICCPAPLPPGCCSRCWSWKSSSSSSVAAGWLSRSTACLQILTSVSGCRTASATAHPLARFSIPQYSSASSLQGDEVLLQPTSSDMSPQSSSPLHCRVRWMQRPEREEEERWTAWFKFTWN